MDIKTLKDARAWVADWKGKPAVVLLDSAIDGRKFILGLAHQRGDTRKAAREAKILAYFQRVKQKLYEPKVKAHSPKARRLPWIHNEPKVWKVFIRHFMAEVRPAPYDYHGPQRWMADMWIGSSAGGTNVHRVDMKSPTPAEARAKVEAEYKKLVRMKSWLLDLPVGPQLAEGGKRRHGIGQQVTELKSLLRGRR